MAATQSELQAALEAQWARLDDAVSASVRAAAERVPAFAERLSAAGLTASQVRGVRDLDKLPVLTKDEVLALQRSDPPFGRLLADDAPVERIFQSPGPVYEPQLAGRDPWRWLPALQAAGIGPGDVVLNCFGYHLSPAGAMFESGVLAVGGRVVPGGVGSLDLQVQAITDVGVTGYTGLPSYLKALIERAAVDGLLDRWRLSKALVTAEPLPDSLRSLLRAQVPTVLMAYGTAECGLLGYEVSPGGGLVVPPDVLVQVCDLDTGLPISSGEGQVVVTLLRPDYPLVRFGTGDLSAWFLGPDGAPRLAGVLGRVGQAVKVRGMFLHPRQAQAVLAGLPGVSGYRLVVDRVDHRDVLRCEVVVASGSDEASVLEAVQGRVRDGLRFSAEVTAVDTLPEGSDLLVDQRDWA